MEKGLLITLPRHDDVTEYFSRFSIYIEEEALIRGINLKKLKDKEANKEDFEKALSKLNYNFVVFNGHGSETTIKGYKDKIIIESGVNDFILSGRIIYARSCHAAAFLSKDCMKNNKDGCLQVLDFVSWAIFRKYESKDEEFYNIIRNKITTEKPMFSMDPRG